MIEDERPAGDPRDSGARASRTLAAGFEVTPPLPPRIRTFARRDTSRASRRRGRSPNFVALWCIVSGLWTVATCLRIQRAWGGWPAVLGSPFTWISLLLPPLVFAIVLIAMNWVARRTGR
jgi:hypothetical protein